MYSAELEECLPQEKTGYAEKNILVMSVIALDSSFVLVGHQLHQ